MKVIAVFMNTLERRPSRARDHLLLGESSYAALVVTATTDLAALTQQAAQRFSDRLAKRDAGKKMRIAKQESALGGRGGKVRVMRCERKALY